MTASATRLPNAICCYVTHFHRNIVSLGLQKYLRPLMAKRKTDRPTWVLADLQAPPANMPLCQCHREGGIKVSVVAPARARCK